MSRTPTRSRALLSPTRRDVPAAAPGRRGIRALAIAAALAVAASLGIAAPAAAAGDTAVLTIAKSASVTEVKPGESFVWKIEIGCESLDTICADAVLTDSVPAPFVLTGAQVVGTQAPADVTRDGNDLTVVFKETDDRFPGVVGLDDGEKVSVLLSVTLPTSTPVTANGVPVTNTADVVAANASKRSSSSTVTPRITETVAVDTTKSWSPSSQVAGSTAATTLTLGVANTSNVDVTALTLVEPAADTANPFDVVRFDSFGAVKFPAGADRVAVTAITAEGAVTGEPSATLALPDGVAPADVRGLEFRFTSTDGTIDASGAAGSVKFAVTQRAGIPTDVTTEVPNTVHATVESPKGTATDTASADLTIAPLSVSVAATKKFTPTTVKAGESSTVEVAARNASNHALTSLTITEPAPGTTDLAANGLAFTGFGANGDGAVNLPTGATSAVVTIQYSDGAGTPVTVGSGDSWPAAQSGRTVVGFTVTYTGEFAPNTVATVPFRVTTDAATPAKVDNVVQTGGSSAAGDATPATATATLTVTPLVVDSIVKKSLTPDSVSGVVGQELVASLEAEVKDSTAPVRRIVLEDSPNATGGSTLWGAFEVQQLVGAKVPAGGTMQVQIWNGTAWVDHGDPVAGAATVTRDLPASAQGVRLVVDSTSPNGFSNGTKVTARLLFELAEAQEPGTVLANCATSTVTGDAGLVGGADQPACDTVTIGTGGVRPLLSVDTTKTWSPSTLWVSPVAPSPTSTLVVAVKNTTPVPVERLELAEPTGGTDPFEYVDITKLTSIDLPAGADASSVAIRLERADGSAVFEQTGAGAVAAAKALDAATLREVIAIFVTVDGVIDTNASLKLTIATAVRETTRSAGEPVLEALAARPTPYTVGNTVTGIAERAGAEATDDASASITIKPLSQQPLAATLAKDIDGASGTVYSADPNRTQKLTLRIDGSNDSKPTVLVIEDVDPTFWNAFDFRGVASVKGTAAAGLDARIDYLTGGTFELDADGAPVVTGATWKPGTQFTVPVNSGALPAAATALPDGVTAADVQGIRVTFLATGDATIPTSFTADGTEGQRIVVNIASRTHLRTGGPVTDTSAATPMPGETQPGVVTNTATGTASNPVTTVEVPEDGDDYTFTPGTIAFTVSKTPDASQLVPGQEQPFKLTVVNTGSTPLWNPVFTDVLPADAQGPLLAYDPVRGTPASFAAEPNTGSMPTNPEQIDVEIADGAVTVTFPEGSALLPGQTYTVTLPMTVRAGVAPGADIDNLFVFTADGDVRGEDGASVVVIEGGAYQRIKDVREIVLDGDEPTGVFNTLPGQTECITDGGFYRVPCLVRTRPGGVEEWRLRVTNTGNLPTTTMTIVDVLPHPGDTGTSKSLSSLSRGSTWAPRFIGDVNLADLPEGAEATVWYQTAADERCVFTGDPLSADPFGDGCADGGWHAEKPADSSEVTAIKVQIDFAEPLQPGDGVELRYRTRTLVTLPEGAPEVDAPAWNSMVVFTTTDAGDGDLEYETLEPNKAGITFQLPDFKVAVGDVVWIDSDRDGIQDDGELPLDGVTVALFEKDGTKVGETQTDEHGRYLFDELPVGEYFIEFTLTDEQAARFAFTADGAGDDRAADSNADPATGRTPVFRLDRPSDETPEVIEAGDYADQEVIASYIDPTIDAGVIPFKVSVGDYVWLDADEDGLQEEGELGIPGVVLVLEGPDSEPVTDVHGNPVGPVATDDTGFYEFVDLPVLPAGQHYTVRIDAEASATVLAPYLPTIPGAGDDREVDSSTEWAESGDLVNDGDRDPSLDFGFVFKPLPTLPLDPDGELGKTGVETVGWIAAALGLLLAGAVALFGTRRRGRHRA